MAKVTKSIRLRPSGSRRNNVISREARNIRDTRELPDRKFSPELPKLKTRPAPQPSGFFSNGVDVRNRADDHSAWV